MGSLFSLFSECIGSENDSDSPDISNQEPLLSINQLNSLETRIESNRIKYESLSEKIEEINQNIQKRDSKIKDRVGYLEKRMDALGYALNGSMIQEPDLASTMMDDPKLSD